MLKKATRYLTSATVMTFVLMGLLLSGCSTDSPVQPSAEPITAAKADPTGTGSFALEAKYDYCHNYPGGAAVYLLRIIPGPDFTGTAKVTVEADKLLKKEITAGVLDAETVQTELFIDISSQVPYGLYNITVTVANQTCEEAVVLQLEVDIGGITSMVRAVDTRDFFIAWLATEHPELGSFAGEQWEIFATYGALHVVETYTHLSDNWEFRVACHITWGTDVWNKMWLRPRGEWDATVAAWYHWDEVSQSFITEEIPPEDFGTTYGY